MRHTLLFNNGESSWSLAAIKAEVILGLAQREAGRLIKIKEKSMIYIQTKRGIFVCSFPTLLVWFNFPVWMWGMCVLIKYVKPLRSQTAKSLPHSRGLCHGAFLFSLPWINTASWVSGEIASPCPMSGVLKPYNLPHRGQWAITGIALSDTTYSVCTYLISKVK